MDVLNAVLALASFPLTAGIVFGNQLALEVTQLSNSQDERAFLSTYGTFRTLGAVTHPGHCLPRNG